LSGSIERVHAVSKGSRNRQQAREKITKMRALEARRRRRRSWVAGIGGAVVAIAVAVGITLAVAGSSGGSILRTGGTPQLKLSPLASLGTLRPAGFPGPTGPEGVPIPRAAPLASTATAATGTDVDGIGCQSSEQTVFHIHAHLTIFVDGSPRQVPAGIGVPGAQAQSTTQGPFVSSGTCFYWLHTFAEWGQPLGPHHLGPATGRVAAIYNGQRYTGNPRDIPLNPHAQIQLEIGTPLVAPATITFPPGL
jgi:hypothetical protein